MRSGYVGGLVTIAIGVATMMASGCRREAEMPAGGARCEARSYDAGSDTMHTLQIYDYDASRRLVRAEWQYHELAFEKRGAIMTFEYDAKGRLVTHTTDEDLDGKPDSVERFTYDESGRLAKKEATNPPSPLVTSTVLVYENGKHTRTEWRRGAELTSFETLAYSPDGAQITTTSTYANGPVYGRTREELDASGHVVRVFDQPGSPEGARLSVERAYDAAGRLVSETTFDRTGAPETTTTYHYAQGVLESSDVSNRGAVSLHTAYTYRGAWNNSVRCGELPQPK